MHRRATRSVSLLTAILFAIGGLVNGFGATAVAATMVAPMTMAGASGDDIPSGCDKHSMDKMAGCFAACASVVAVLPNFPCAPANAVLKTEQPVSGGLLLDRRIAPDPRPPRTTILA